MTLQAHLHNPTSVTIQRYPKSGQESFATISLLDAKGSELCAFINDPALARQLAESATTLAEFLEEEQAIADIIKNVRAKARQTLAEIEHDQEKVNN